MVPVEILLTTETTELPHIKISGSMARQIASNSGYVAYQPAQIGYINFLRQSNPFLI